MHQKERIINSVEYDKFMIGLRDDGIYHVYFKDNTKIDLALQLEKVEAFNKFTGGKPCLFIFEAGNNCTLTKDARDNAARITNLSPYVASVTYVQNMVYRMLARFYYSMNPPAEPNFIASDFSAGIKWLKEQNIVKLIEIKEIQAHKLLEQYGLQNA